MRLDVALNESVEAASECLFLPAEAGLQLPAEALNFDRAAMQELAAESLALMGLSDVLRPGHEYKDDVVNKPHERVSQRDAAVTEQFHHPDVAMNGFCGIFLVGLEGSDPKTVPETHVPDNADMVSHVTDFVANGPLQDRLEEIVVVRPFFDDQSRAEWMNLPRHSLKRLGDKFESLLTPAQLEHVRRELANVTDTSRYVGNVSISALMADSLIDGSPLLTCGVAQRELRLALDGPQNEDEDQALTELHDEITKYLMDPATPYKAKKVVEGSAIFVPVNQLHRATPYGSHHRRSVVGVRCYASPGQPSPDSWQLASGLEY